MIELFCTPDIDAFLCEIVPETLKKGISPVHTY